MAEERKGSGEGTGILLEPHSVLKHLGRLRMEAHILLRLGRNKNFGHSLAEAPLHHHKAQVVVQGSLGHSPGSLLKAPRLRVVPAQGAGVLVRRVDVAMVAIVAR